MPPWMEPPWRMTAHLPRTQRIIIEARRKQQMDMLCNVLLRHPRDGKSFFGFDSRHRMTQTETVDCRLL